MFPIITNIKDVLPFIQDKPEFKVVRKDNYTAINYRFQSDNSFDSPQALECRGIKFYPDGTIASRPFQKFFNRGERMDERRDIEQCKVFEKLDGTLIHGISLNNECRLMSKAGITDYSIAAEKLLTPKLSYFLSLMERNNLTPLFEFVGFEQIVINYSTPKLVLLAVRHKVIGEYLSQDLIESYAKTYSLSLPRYYNTSDINLVKDWVGSEGVVLFWEDGEMLKIKSDDYILKAKVKENIDQENKLLELIINDNLDDIIMILDKEEHSRILKYKNRFLKNVKTQSNFLEFLLEDLKSLSRKEIAIYITTNLTPSLQKCFWMLYNKKFSNAEDAILKLITKNLSNQKSVEKVRSLIGTTWITDKDKID